MELTLKLTLMGKTGSLVSISQKIPNGFSRIGNRVKLKTAKLKTNRGNRGIPKPSNDLVVFTVLIFELVFIFGSKFSILFHHGDNMPKFPSFEEGRHGLGPQYIIETIK
ncbi:hypothetical protein CsSME_00043686 [Camellia sinensis var. sinensis]